MQALIADSVDRYFGYEMPVRTPTRPLREQIKSRLAGTIDRINERRLRRGEPMLTGPEIELMALKEFRDA